MRISFFKVIDDNCPEYVDDLTWEKLVELLSTHESTALKKTQCSLFCPAEFVEGGTRSKNDAIRVHLAVLDLDGPKDNPGIPDADLETVLDLCSQYEYLLYTSFSHASVASKGRNKIRIVFPLSRPVLASEWPRFWIRMSRALSADLCDPMCKNVDRFYVEPYAPIGTEASHYTVHNPGAILDVTEILNLPGPIASAPTSAADGDAENITQAHLVALCTRLRARSTAHAQLVYQALLKIRAGKEFAPEGERDDTLFRVTGEIVRAYPKATPESVIALLAPSLQIMEMQAPGAPDANAVRDKIDRAKAAQAKAAEEKQQIQESDLKYRIRECFGGTRDHAYTSDEIVQMAQDTGVTPEEFMSHWIYQKGGSYYFRVLDQIRGPRVRQEMSKVATILLAPAATASVDAYKTTPTGIPVPKSPDELVEDYGTPVATVQASLIAQYSHFDRATSTLVEAVCPLRTIPAKYDPEVAEWLELFAGPLHEKLLDWMALLPDLSHPLPALYFDGPGGAGKTLFAESIARLWSTVQATPMSALTRAFNSQIVECPVIFADEIVPPEFRGDRGTGRLRALIAERSRSLTRKFIPDATLIGAIRLVIAGNNDTLISAEENLTDEDISAIIDRIFYLEIQEKAGPFLASLCDLGDSFRYKDRVAGHVHWLAENRTVVRSGRFGVRGEAGKLHRTMTVSAGSRSPVLNWLVGALNQWEAISIRPKVESGIRVQDGEIWVNASAIVEGWDLVKTNAKAPSTQRIGKALGAFSKPERKEHNGIKFRVIRNELLLAWVEETGYMSREQLKGCMDRAERRQEKRAN